MEYERELTGVVVAAGLVVEAVASGGEVDQVP